MLPFDDEKEADPLHIGEPYLMTEPYVEYGGLDYVGGTTYESSHPQYWWVHTLGAIVNALVQAGLTILSLEEHQCDISAGHRRQEQAGIAIPLSYVLLAEGRAPDSR